MTLPMDGLPGWPYFDANVSFDDARDALWEAGLSDGLPLVPPTKTRLDGMLSGADAARSHGMMPPLFGELTNAAVAYNCVIAGCEPGALPVVLTAAVAALEAPFNLLGIATTTGAPAVATIVHGPAAGALGMNAGVNCLGSGNRANATLGRAISLVLRNVGGMREGVGDMATMGQPGKYGFCFAESGDRTLIPFHVRRGLQPEVSAVTVIGVSGTAEALPSVESGNWDRPEDILEPVASLMHATLVAGGGARKSERGEQVLLLPPELAGLIAQRGWDLGQIQNYLFDSADRIGCGPVAADAGDIHIIVTGGPGIKMTVLPPWGGGTRAVTLPLVEP
jgi:hypothetical protein